MSNASGSHGRFERMPTWSYPVGRKGFECLIDDGGVTISSQCRGSKHIQPTWCNDSDAKRYVTGVDEEYVQDLASFCSGLGSFGAGADGPVC